MDPRELIAVEHPRPIEGIPTHSDDALRLWTPTLGPTAMLLAYRLAGDVERDGPTTYVVDGLAADLGVMVSKVTSAVKRLHRLNVALVHNERIAIRLTLSMVTDAKPVPQPLTFTVTEVAEMLGISRGAAYKAVKDGDIPSVQFGRRVLIPRHKFHERFGDL